MDVIDYILQYLEENKLDKTVTVLKKELKSKPFKGKKDKKVIRAIKKELKSKGSDESMMNKENAPKVTPENEAIMENLMTRLITSQKYTVVPNLDKFQKLPAFQRMLEHSDQLFFDSESMTSNIVADSGFDDEIPSFGKNVTENRGDDSTENHELESFAGQDEDEIVTVQKDDEEPSAIIQDPSASFGAMELVEDEGNDEYKDDDDPGFEGFNSNEDNFMELCQDLAAKYNFPARAMRPKRPQDFKWIEKAAAIEASREEDRTIKGEVEDSLEDSSFVMSQPKCSMLPATLKFPNSNDDFYPVEFENVIYDCYPLRVVYDREKTGFEETKDFQIIINSVVAGRFQVVEYLGSAAFSKAIQCLDIFTQQMVCLKIIENNKDYFDQSIDEIKLLKFINLNGEADDKHVLKMHDCFYHKEHLFIVTELLRDNLYEFSRYNRENEDELYFTVGRLQRISKQLLEGLDFIHGLRLIHCDLKPENILIKSYSRCEVKIIDFGSSCFIHDHLSSYVQSRSYRAPEVILGCKYDYKIDIWSLGCIIGELYTGNVLFQNDTVQGLLARVVGIMGPFPDDMLKTGRLVDNFFTKEKLLYQEVTDEEKNKHLSEEMAELLKQKKKSKIQIMVPKKTSLKARLRTDDAMFLDFIRCLLDVDKDRRPSAKEALQHPWITECKYTDGLP